MQYERAHAIGEAFWRGLRPRRPRTMREFAEQELVLSNGPRAGLRFSCDFMPWTGLLLAEMDGMRYRRFFGSGPVQSGKSLLLFVLPALYHLFELQQNVILGAPKIDIARGIYEERLLPVIRGTRYAELLPRRGPGSKGGRFLSVQFRNGTVLRLMGAGGRDSQRSTFTAPVVLLTELDKMDVAGEASREADPVTQMEARAESFGIHARVYGECTMSLKSGRVYREVVEEGTDTTIRVPCPHCRQYVACERANFSGWQDAPDILAARARACFVCPGCSAPWTEADRLAALRIPVLVARGQTVTPDGHVTGELPPTNTFGFRWNAMHNALRTMADIGEAEWKAERTGDPSLKKALTQFTWAEPYEEEQLALAGIGRESVLSKIVRAPRGIVPAGAVRVSVGLDVGLRYLYYVAVAWNEDARGLVFEYGAVTVPQGPQPDASKILHSLREFREDFLVHGWPTASGSRRAADLVVIDSGYQPDYVYTFVLESGQGRYVASKGYGTASQRAWHSPKPVPGRQQGREWYVSPQPGSAIRLVDFHADHWKEQVHAGFMAPAAAPGSLTLYEAEPVEHLQFARHILAEHQEDLGAGKVRWIVTSKQNHYLDALAEARLAADMLGIRMVEIPAQPAARTVAGVKYAGQRRRIRTRYA